jgi:SPP1 family predicted phage head-tail adaptor
MSQNGLRSGDLRRRVTVQQRTVSVDTFGQQAVSWSSFLECWADIQPSSGRELIAAQAQQSEVTHQVVIRYRSGVLPAMRVLYQGRVFDIQSVIDVDTQHRRLALMCSEGLNQG